MGVDIAADVDLYNALPASPDYYTYRGSITAPPCTEGAVWVVMSGLNSMSGKQEKEFPFQNNFRPPQALNGRTVFFLSEGEDAFDVQYQYKTEWSVGPHTLSMCCQWSCILLPPCLLACCSNHMSSNTQHTHTRHRHVSWPRRSRQRRSGHTHEH